MEEAELVLDYIRALSWPGVVALALLLFRGKLNDLLARLTDLEAPGGVKVSFGQQVERAQDELDEADGSASGIDNSPSAIAPAQTSPDFPSPTGSNSVFLRELASASPEAAVLAAWQQLEVRVRDLARSRHLPSDGPVHRLLLILAQQAELSTDFKDGLNRLRRLRNDVSHATGPDVTASEAREYVDAVLSAIDTLTRRLWPRDTYPTKSAGQ